MYKDGTCGVLTSRLVPARVAAKTEQKRDEEKEHLKRRKEVDGKQDRNGRESEKGAEGGEDESNGAREELDKRGYVEGWGGRGSENANSLIAKGGCRLGG